MAPLNGIATDANHFNWKSNDILYFLIYLSILLFIALNLPKNEAINCPQNTAIFGFGMIGIWRYSWWLNHVIRAFIYGRILFPRRRLNANQLWDAGWRPERLFFMMTTFRELETTTHIVLQSIIEECNQIAVPVQLFIGTGTEADEIMIENFFNKQKALVAFEVIMVRQKKPGKRYAIGETLRAIHRHGLTADDLIVFMDGDTYFQSGCLRLCLPFFKLFPKIQALTTHEKSVVIHGPTWVKKWLDMRFSQRDFTMQSYSLSNKILTLTGRMSIFRGKHVCEPAFIHIIENDCLQHWLWGNYRFLSGDDKSTWYYLLKHRADMIYIPDATTITIEYIDGNALARMKENLRRWSGNTLRNGARAIALGPRTVGYYIWWCLIDQRCAVWTMIIGHMTILILTVSKSYTILFISLLWIAFSRLCLACMLFIHARRIDMSFPFLIYINQLLSTLIKIYILFRLPQQRWKNRGDQHAGFETLLKWRFKGWVATYITFFYCMCCLLFILIYLNLISLPTLSDIKTFG